MLADGSYEAIVIDADGGDQPDGIHLSITIVSGECKGQVVEVLAAQLQYDPLDLLAMPCILTVQDGHPMVVFD